MAATTITPTAAEAKLIRQAYLHQIVLNAAETFHGEGLESGDYMAPDEEVVDRHWRVLARHMEAIASIKGSRRVTLDDERWREIDALGYFISTAGERAHTTAEIRESLKPALAWLSIHDKLEAAGWQPAPSTTTDTMGN